MIQWFSWVKFCVSRCCPEKYFVTIFLVIVVEFMKIFDHGNLELYAIGVFICIQV